MNLNGMDIWTDSLVMLYNLSGVVKFDPESGKQFKAPSSTLTYTQYFANALIAEAELDSKVVAIHAAMGSGTGLNYFQKHFPQRTFDVGIAEQHAVTFAAGLATEGIIPFCAIYSSFLQRGYDQVGVSSTLKKSEALNSFVSNDNTREPKCTFLLLIILSLSNCNCILVGGLDILVGIPRE
jgi:hypothetical protein